MTRFNFIQADTFTENNQLHLTLPNIKYEELPSVSVLTITYNRKHFFQLMYNNFKNYKYPPEKLEWVIVDDSPGTNHNLHDIIPNYPNIKYIKIDNHMLVGDKRNFGVENCSHDIIVHQDDDDYYFADSILAKVRILKQYPKCGCVFSNNLAAYNITNNISYMMDPENPESCLTLPEASMMYKKSFWQTQKFKNTHFAEGKSFVIGREKKCVSIPCIFNMISLTHGNNMTGLSRHVEYTTSTSTNNTKISNFFNLMDPITQNIIKKLSKHALKNIKPTNYNKIFFKNFTSESKNSHIIDQGIELNLLYNLENYLPITDSTDLSSITKNDLILVGWYSGYDMFNLFKITDSSSDNSSHDILPKEALTLLEHPRSKLMIYCSWECRNFILPEYKNNFFKYHSKYLNIPLERIILSTSDFLNPLIHSFSPQIFGYDYPYLYAKMEINKQNFKIVDKNTSDKSSAICFLSRRGNLERTAIALFLFTFFKHNSTISYLTKDTYDSAKIKQLGVLTNSYQEFINSLPIQLDYPDSDNHTTELLGNSKNPTVTVKWNSYSESLFQHINNSFVMLICETNAEGPLSVCQQISEKSYKAISLCMPFIIFTAKPGILKHLKSQGFKTFHPHICEEYDHTILPERSDAIEDLSHEYNVRFRKLLKEINRICSMNHQQLSDLWNLCYPIATHNFEILKNTQNIKPLPIIE